VAGPERQTTIAVTRVGLRNLAELDLGFMLVFWLVLGHRLRSATMVWSLAIICELSHTHSRQANSTTLIDE